MKQTLLASLFSPYTSWVKPCTIFMVLSVFFHRFSSVTERFFMELNTRRIDTSVARSETLSIINGMRYLKLGVCVCDSLIPEVNGIKQGLDNVIVYRLRLKGDWMHRLPLWRKQILLAVFLLNAKVSFTMHCVICFQTFWLH